MEYKFTIPLRPITKKNSQRIIKDNSGHVRIIPSSAYVKYEKQCEAYMPRIDAIESRIIVSTDGSYVDVDKWHPRTEVTITDLETG